MHTRYFEEFAAGQKFETRGISLTEGQIIDFAMHYDPQPFHVDREYAKAGLFGEVIASGFQTMALAFRLFVELGLTLRSNIVGPGADEVRWTAPVRPGDTIRSIVEVMEVKPSGSKPDRGTVRLLFTVKNQRDETVMTFQSLNILRRRPA